MRKILAVAALCAAPSVLPAHVQEECLPELDAASAAFHDAMPKLRSVLNFITDKASESPTALLNLTPEEAFEFVKLVRAGLQADGELKGANTAFLLCITDEG